MLDLLKHGRACHRLARLDQLLEGGKKFDSQTNRVIASLPRNSGASGVAFGAGSVWLCNRNDSSALMRLDPVTNQVQAQLPFSSPPCASLVALDQTIWVMSFFSGEGNSVRPSGVSDA